MAVAALRQRLFEGVGSSPSSAMEHSAGLREVSESTLEDLVLGVWEDLALSGRAECPVCHGTLVPEGCLHCNASFN